MHRAWLVDDVAELIMEELYIAARKSRYMMENAPVLRTSQRFFELASRYFWRYATLERLWILVRACTAQDAGPSGWARFELYNRSVQELDFNDREIRESGGRLEFATVVFGLTNALKDCPIDPILPCLRSLYRVEASPKGMHLNLAAKLITPSLRGLVLIGLNIPPSVMESENYREELPNGLFQATATVWSKLRQTPALEMFRADLRAVEPSVDRLRLDTLRSLSNLWKLVLNNVTLDGSVLSTICSLSKLKSLYVHVEKDMTQPEDLFSEQTGALPCLTHFEWFGGNTQGLVWLLQTTSVVEQLIVSTDSEDISDIRTITSLVEHSAPSLRRLHLQSGAGGRFPQRALESLLRCKKIEDFSVGPSTMWYFSPTQIQAMAYAWPVLRTLRLPRTAIVDNDEVMGGTIKMDVLALFAEHCHTITTLTLPISVGSDWQPELLPHPPAHKEVQPETLSLWFSRAEKSKPEEVAMFLDQLWPDRKIDVSGTLANWTWTSSVNDLMRFPRNRLAAYNERRHRQV